MRTVFHLISSDPDEQQTTLTLAENLADDEDADMDDIVVVAQADGIDPFRAGGSDQETIQSLQEKGVSFVACGNTLEMKEMAESDLVDDIEVAPSGITELTRLQSEGYAYIRP